MGDDCANCGQPEPFEYDAANNPLVHTEKELAAAKTCWTRDTLRLEQADAELATLRESLKRADGERDELKAHPPLRIDTERENSLLESLANAESERDDYRRRCGILDSWRSDLSVRLGGKHSQSWGWIGEAIPALTSRLERARPILATVAEGLCIFEDLNGIKCELPWPEGPDGKAPDGGPACEPCRAKAFLADAGGEES